MIFFVMYMYVRNVRSNLAAVGGRFVVRSESNR